MVDVFVANPEATWRLYVAMRDFASHVGKLGIYSPIAPFSLMSLPFPLTLNLSLRRQWLLTLTESQAPTPSLGSNPLSFPPKPPPSRPSVPNPNPISSIPHIPSSSFAQSSLLSPILSSLMPPQPYPNPPSASMVETHPHSFPSQTSHLPPRPTFQPYQNRRSPHPKRF